MNDLPRYSNPPSYSNPPTYGNTSFPSETDNPNSLPRNTTTNDLNSLNRSSQLVNSNTSPE